MPMHDSDDDEMMRAVQVEDLHWIRKLLKAGRPVDQTSLMSGRQITPFYRACEMGSIETCRMLLKAGANIDFQTANGFAGLHEAVDARDEELTKFLLGRGARVDIENAEGETPLARAIKDDNLPLVKLVVEAGAQPGRPPANGVRRRTPFEESLYVSRAQATKWPDSVRERMEIISYLVLECGMNPDPAGPIASGLEFGTTIAQVTSEEFHLLLHSLKAEVEVRRALASGVDVDRDFRAMRAAPSPL
jgi:hypothetical protein